MRLLTSTLALFLSIIVVGATLPHDSSGISARHNRLAQRASSLEARAAAAKRCPNRTSKKVTTSPAPTNNLVKSNNSSSKAPAQTPAAQPPTTNGLINVKSNCGAIRATKEVTKLSGPNGHIDWLNCGFETSHGWQPPFIRMQDVITQSLSSALKSPSSPFKACSNFVWIFEKYGNQFGVPAIILASFAMQESGCNPATVGGAGEQGLMQITQEKCVGAPGGNCRDPEFNIRTAAKFFAATLAANNGDVLASVGNYNGWHRGLTQWAAFAAGDTPCCRCQNNGDYLHQFFNGWCQNVNPYSHNPPLGKYFNLAKCG
ncbi:hypothetical protein GALMADRAFT_1332852 [Galerina marginata CBS 339.88]|uniref:Transglycosylase SLT domain-containing protein n=1 Tax=Galerina marginata (strain CBS 339.88) TaxID=685588 RepID=A0A067SWF1_GALM3|nr:hypothetical protein GALMADRAFT_1332852 [Galerina marginata CBS 339.88]